MAHGKGNKKAQPYAQNPYGGMYAGSMTENRYDYMTNMPKQGFKSDTQLNEELLEEEETKERKGKGKTLLTAKY
jgi:hypothetical protein